MRTKGVDDDDVSTESSDGEGELGSRRWFDEGERGRKKEKGRKSKKQRVARSKPAARPYHPRRGLRERMRVWGYNCQMMNHVRAREWSEEFRGCFVGMQGTSATYDPDKSELQLQLWHTDHHDIWENKH